MKPGRLRGLHPLKFNMNKLKKILIMGLPGAGKSTLAKALPNITSILYGRDVGYTIEKIDLPETLTSISATAILKEQNS